MQSVGRGRGKVILFGEHAVVYGIPALAVGIENGATAVSTPTETTPVYSLSADAFEATQTAGDESNIDRCVAAISNTLDVAITQDIAVEFSTFVGCGLGSSAAMANAIARALKPSATESDVRLAVDAAEAIFHGNPSGIDAEATMRDGLFRFVRDVDIETVSGAPFSLIVCRAEPGASTAAMVEHVGSLYASHRSVQQLFDSVTTIVDDAIIAIAEGDWHSLGELMNINHGIMSAVGVSTPGLETAIGIARDAGAYGAKLTGAGGGGCIIAIGPESVSDALALAGYDLFEARVG